MWLFLQGYKVLLSKPVTIPRDACDWYTLIRLGAMLNMLGQIELETLKVGPVKNIFKSSNIVRSDGVRLRLFRSI